MSNIKSKIGKKLPFFIEQMGYLVNPLLVNFISEENHIIVFYFHGVYENESQRNSNHVDPQNNVTVKEFTEFVEYFLEENYVFIKPEDIYTGLSGNRKYAMITFDDGYFNNTLAIDVLEKYGVPAVIFVSTQNVQANHSYWWDVIYKYRKKQNVPLVEIKVEQQRLKKHKYSQIQKYIQEQLGPDAMIPWSDIDRPLSENELKEISSNPLISIGNHTHNHAILTNYNEEEIKMEFELSNNFFSKLIGEAPTTIAFPNGNFNEFVLRVTQEAGFKLAFSTIQKKNVLPITSETFSCLNRLMYRNSDRKTYGNFYRIGYNPTTLYADIKGKILKKG